MTFPLNSGPEFWKSEDFYRYVVESCTEGVCASDANYRFVFVNPKLAEILGRPAGELIGMDVTETVQGEFRRKGHDVISRRKEGLAHRYDMLITRPDGTQRWLMVVGNPVMDADGRNLGSIAIASDITERVLAEQELRKREQQLSAAEQIAHLGSWSWSASDGSILWSDEMYRMSGLAPRSVQLTPEFCLNAIHPEDRERCIRMCENALATRSPFQFHQRIIRPDGSLRHFLTQGRVICDAQGTPQQIVGLCMDVTEQKRGEQQLHYLMYHDSVTGLPNQHLLLERADECLARARRHNRKCALLVLDIDRFKAVNESLGQPGGDELLKIVAQRIHEAVKDVDFAARLGGDKFAVLIEEIHANSNAAFMARLLLSAIEKTAMIDSRPINVSACAGIACYPDDGDDARTLLRRAENALRRAKQLGRGRYRFYANDLGRSAEQTLTIAHGLESAFSNDEFFLVYQPRVRLHDNAVTGVQALARWQYPGHRLLREEQFMSVAEDMGRAGDVERWILRTACRDAMRWRKQGAPALRLAIRLASRQTVNEDFIAMLRLTLRETDFPAADLELCLSGAVTAGNSALGAVIEMLAADGVHVTLGEFSVGGTGCARLLDLPFRAVCLSAAQVDMLDSTSRGAALAEAAALVARRGGLKAIADGVARDTQLAKLREIDCDEAQGPYFAEPLPAFAMKAYLQSVRVAPDNAYENG